MLLLLWLWRGRCWVCEPLNTTTQHTTNTKQGPLCKQLCVSEGTNTLSHRDNSSHSFNPQSLPCRQTMTD